jgi:tetratricopeptide (TPR) repeat protein/2-polyprenyl-3-methyl-5-hydroxy-6-metoxy-1,4-benzoquinol methylase
MRDFERNPQDQATPQPDQLPSTASRELAAALIEAGNALEAQGQVAEAMARYDAAAQADPLCARAHLNRGNILLAGAQLDQARSAYQLAITCNPQYAAAHFNLGNLNYGAGEFENALENYRLSVGIKTDFADAHLAMANAFDSLGRPAEARQSYERALAINPDYAEVHFNLGVLEISQGRTAEALKRLRRAAEIKPDVAQFHYTLGTTLSALGQLDEAESSLRQALSIEPASPETVCELAIILQCSRRSPEAVQLIVHMLEHAPTWTIKSAFAYCVANTRFAISEPQTRTALTTAISEPWGIPGKLCQPALSLIMLNEEIASCVRRANGSWPAILPKSRLFGVNGLAALAADPLLNALLEAAPVTTIEFERFLTCARRALLETASSTRAPDPSDIAALQFYAALSRQCFVNEYIFNCDDEERVAAVTCRERLLALLDAHAAAPPHLLLAVAAYFPLYSLRDASRLLTTNETRAVAGVLRQQISEPLEEQALRAGIGCLTAITSGVSEIVRDQYEQNPYPRWVKLPICDQPQRFNDELRHKLPFSSFTPLPDDSAPEVLVAGCGTGIHSILVAQRIRGARVLAIDLSLSSISYAIRKTQELEIANIEYAQADILNFGDVARTFDVIESVGVLHHLADPFIGWRALLSRLRPGGFMGLGFYSEVARRHVVKAREFIAARGYTSTPDDIRRFRQDLAGQDTSVDMHWLTNSADFYSTSECRDLLFHVQEHRLTLGQIELFLAECRLNFLGFELDPRVRHQYRRRFTDDPSGSNLRNWTLFEADNPRTFVGMYQFWIQKPITA